MQNLRDFDPCDIFLGPPALQSSQNVSGPPTLVVAVIDFEDRERGVKMDGQGLLNNVDLVRESHVGLRS